MALLLLTLLILLQLTLTSSLEQSYYPPSPFDVKIANQSVYYSAAAACGQDAYPKMVVAGPIESFKYLYTLYDKKSDTQCYIGVQ
jgi:hypothetical protein